MTSRKISCIAAMVSALALGACAGGPQTDAPQDMEFVWGCWVQKQPFGRDGVVFLRLLPNTDRTAYEGRLSAYIDNEAQPGGRASFARDGSQATFFLDEEETIGGAGARAPEPAGWPQGLPSRAFFTPQPAPHNDHTEYLLVEGDKERLILTVTDREGAELLPLFDFERDGCD
jgi:hypothetical protein